MEWSDEELSDVMSRGSSAAPTGIRVPALPASTLNAMMTRAVELAAARGGTMTAERLREAQRYADALSPHNALHEALGALASQGARNAVLKAENDALKTEMARREEVFNRVNEACRDAENRADAMETLRDREHARADAHDKERNEAATCLESIRRRSLEAGNLERLIAEHGLPAAMRWVVDGEEPQELMDPTPDRCAPCLCTGDDHPHRLFGAIWRCSNCGEIGRWPCSSTCTHDDAATPGHSERVKERSEALWRVVASDAKCHAPKHINCPCTWDPPQACHFPTPDGEPSEAAWQEAHELQQAHDRGAEAMRAACLKDVRDVLANVGAWDRETERIVTAAIEGATP